MTKEELRNNYGYLLANYNNDGQLDELLNMSQEQLLEEFDRVCAAQEKLREAEYVLENVGWLRRDEQNLSKTSHLRKYVYTTLPRELIMKETTIERTKSGSVRYNARKNMALVLEDIKNMLWVIYFDNYGCDNETGKINDKYSKKFAEFWEEHKKMQ